MFNEYVEILNRFFLTKVGQSPVPRIYEEECVFGYESQGTLGGDGNTSRGGGKDP